MQFNFVDFVVALACSKINFLCRLFTYFCALADLRNLTTIASCLHIASMTIKQNPG